MMPPEVWGECERLEVLRSSGCHANGQSFPQSNHADAHATINSSEGKVREKQEEWEGLHNQ
jgi:hypothetical protein